MNDLNKMRLGVLKELKNVHLFFDNMERNVKSRNPEAIQKAYIFLKTMVVLMNDGELSPTHVALNVEIEQGLKEVTDDTHPR